MFRESFPFRPLQLTLNQLQRIVLYPAYMDVEKTWSQGRRVPKAAGALPVGCLVPKLLLLACPAQCPAQLACRIGHAHTRGGGIALQSC